MKSAMSVVIMAILWQLSAASRKKHVTQVSMDIANKTAVDCACNERWGTLRPFEALHWNQDLQPDGTCNAFNGGGSEGALHLPLSANKEEGGLHNAFNGGGSKSANKELTQCDCNPEYLGLAKADNYNEQVKLVMEDVAVNAELQELKNKFELNLVRMKAEFAKKWEEDVHALEAEYGVKFAMPKWSIPAAMPKALTVEKFVLRDNEQKKAKWSCCCKSKKAGKCKAKTWFGVGGIAGYHHEAPPSAC